MDLSRVENRKNFIENLENEFIETLRKLGLNISEKAVCIIGENDIELGVCYNDEGRYRDFASEITLTNERKMFGDDIRPFEINFGSSGAFNPSSSKASYWRTIHASEVLQNWDDVCKLVAKFCNEITKLREIPVIKEEKEESK